MYKFTLLATLCVGLSLPASAQHVVQDHFDLSFSGMLGIDDAEFTPDGRLIVARENTAITTTRVYDANTGDELLARMPTTVPTTPSGVCYDAVAVTNERAVVLGSASVILDLTQPGFPTILEQETGGFPRDLEITPDGSKVAIRGGWLTGSNGGLYIYDLATGGQLFHLATLNHQPGPWVNPDVATPVDSVAVTNEHAVFLSYISQGQPLPVPRTSVTIVDLTAAGGPQVVYETGPGEYLEGAPHDIVFRPDGAAVAVRSEYAVSLFRTNGPLSYKVWEYGIPNVQPQDNATLDSLEVTNDRIVTISRMVSTPWGGRIDLLDMTGAAKYDYLLGDPHDLALTPSGEQVLIRTHSNVYMYDISAWPVGLLEEIDIATLNSTNASWGAGMDTIVCNDEQAVAIAAANGITRVRLYDISNDSLELTSFNTVSDTPVDVDLTPDGRRALISCSSSFAVYDMRSGQELFEHDPIDGGGYPWCDGVAVRDHAAVAFGYQQGNGPGWLSVIDMFGEPEVYCSSTINSTGSPGSIWAQGSARVSFSDLELFAVNMPAAQPCAFVHGDTQVSTPFGDGLLCIGGQGARWPVQLTDAQGGAALDVVYSSVPGGMLLPGTSWNFQLWFRDPTGPGGSGLNTTDAINIPFE